MDSFSKKNLFGKFCFLFTASSFLIVWGDILVISLPFWVIICGLVLYSLALIFLVLWLWFAFDCLARSGSA